MEERQRFEILLESIESKVRLIAEGHSLLLRQIQEVREEAKKQEHSLQLLSRIYIKGLMG